VIPRQTIAYEHPCARADETQHMRFTTAIPPWFTILTVNK